MGLTIFAALVARAATWREATVLGLAFGAGANLVALRFVPVVLVRFTPLPAPAAGLALALLAVAQGLAWAAAGACAWAGAKAGVPRPLALAGGVYAATFAKIVFPWSVAGTLAAWPALLQAAELVGERGVSALVALACALVAEPLAAPGRGGGARSPRPARIAAASGAALVGALAAYGTARLRAIDAATPALPTARVALVQPSIGAATRWDPARAADILAELTRLTRAAEADVAPDLTVWHETAYPYALAAATRRCPTGEGALLGHGVRGPVLTGLLLTLGHGDAWNAAAVCAPGDELSAPSAKRRLLPFGEHVPFGEELPWLRRAFVRGTGLVPGTHAELQRAGSIRAGVLVCFEDTLPDAGRDALEGAPNLLVNLTNDAWFAGTAEPELHLRLAALRAIELRRDLVRAVNLGPPSWIDAGGRVRARGPADTPSYLTATPALREERTLYARAGDAPYAAALALASLAWAFARRGHSRTVQARRRA